MESSRQSAREPLKAGDAQGHLPFQNGTCLSLIGQLAGEVEVGLKWQYLHAARDFLGHAHVLLLWSL